LDSDSDPNRADPNRADPNRADPAIRRTSATPIDRSIGLADATLWRIGTAARHLLGDAVFDLVAGGGHGALTLRKVASRMGIRQSWLSDRFDNRARMLAIATGVIGERWSAWIGARSGRLGIAAFLPDSDDGVVATRVWLALVELGRVEEQSAWRVAQVRRDERSLLSRLRGPAEPDQRIDELLALVDGLRAAIADPIHPLRLDRARGLLERNARRG
jgi:hypothetical protein